MEKYIIKYRTKTNGKWVTVYHMDITENNNDETMNVYVEHLTRYKRKAKQFHEQGEAILVAALFENDYQLAEVITTDNKRGQP